MCTSQKLKIKTEKNKAFAQVRNFVKNSALSYLKIFFIKKKSSCGSISGSQVVKADSGWNFAGHGGTVSRSHTYLYDNIQYQNTSRIHYY